MKIRRDAQERPDPALEMLAREWKAQPENQFDALPLDQQRVRLKETVAYLVRRCEKAEASLLIAETTATNLHDVVRRMCEMVRDLQRYTVSAVEYHGGDGQTFYATTEVEAHPGGPWVKWVDLCAAINSDPDQSVASNGA